VNGVVLAIGFLVALTGGLGIVLAIANARLKVDEDPRVDAVTDALPGTNCGACGQPGCRAFAEKIVAGQNQPGQCTPADPDTVIRIADYLGVEVGDTEKRTARLLCAGGSNVAVQMAEYRGMRTCRAAAAAGGGPKGCRYGCLGFGDCEEVCTFDAIEMSPTGLPIVDVENCTACDDCVVVCPMELFEILPLSQHLIVQCKSELEGDEMLEMCSVGCNGCTKCVADAAQGLFKMKKNLPVINPELFHLQSPGATQRCPTGAIVWVEKAQFESDAEAELASSQRLTVRTADVVEKIQAEN
jgi:Na+-translocating ferredoxin:NAD+ oxidoreductase RNF subunit RnfB